MELAYGVWVYNTLLVTLMIWATNIINDTTIPELGKEFFVCPFEAWGDFNTLVLELGKEFFVCHFEAWGASSTLEPELNKRFFACPFEAWGDFNTLVLE